MRRLEDVIGQQAAVEKILSALKNSSKAVFFVSGPTGSGVSWTIDRIGQLWETEGGVALCARGGHGATIRSLLPWLMLASPTKCTLARWDILKGSLTQASKSVPLVGAVTSYLVDELLNYRKKKLARYATILGEKEQDVMFTIQTSASDRRLLLGIDHLDGWDEESWELLELILSSHLDGFYPALKNAVVVIGTKKDKPLRLNSMVKGLKIDECQVDRLGKRYLPLAAEAFGFFSATDEEQERLYEAAAGRLDLMHDFSSEMVAGASTELGTNSSYVRMVERRLEAAKEHITDLEEFLAAASFLGSSFSLEDFRCLTGQDAQALRARIRLAEDERFLDWTGDLVAFPSAALHQHFHAIYRHRRPSYHRQYAECLRLMRPGDYEARWRHLVLAESDEALCCYVHAVLETRRRLVPRPLGKPPTDGPPWSDFAFYLEKMNSAFDAHREDRLDDAVIALEDIEGILPESLLAERDYLEAQILLKRHRVADFERAVTLLDRWRGLEKKEPELWSRLMQVLCVSLSETNRRDEAIRLEGSLTQYFAARVKTDPWALYGLNCLRRRAECLHHFPAAKTRLENALKYFGATETGILPRHPSQYYYTLTNLIGNLIASGYFEEALGRAQELEQVIHVHPTIGWPSMEVPVNNHILAGYLGGSLPASEAVRLLEQLRDGQVEIGDRILIENNYAVFLIHSGRMEEARKVLEKIYALLDEGEESDAYHRYFVANNLAAILALSGEASSATLILDQVGAELGHFYLAVRETLIKRHELFRPLLQTVSGCSPQVFDQLLTTRHLPQLGKQWSFYGRGFLFSDIQFWSAE